MKGSRVASGSGQRRTARSQANANEKTQRSAKSHRSPTDIVQQAGSRWAHEIGVPRRLSSTAARCAGEASGTVGRNFVDRVRRQALIDARPQRSSEGAPATPPIHAPTKVPTSCTASRQNAPDRPPGPSRPVQSCDPNAKQHEDACVVPATPLARSDAASVEQYPTKRMAPSNKRRLPETKEKKTKTLTLPPVPSAKTGSDGGTQTSPLSTTPLGRLQAHPNTHAL